MRVRKFNLKTEGVLLLIFATIILVYRFWTLTMFGFKYTDSDQSIMWLGTKNYSQGLFHEPLFYGQNYNSMLESLLAVPLFKLGTPLHIALPIITTLLTLLPFFIISIFTYLKSSKFTGILILTIPILLPVEYDFMTSISRGFVTGLAIASIGLFAMFQTKSQLSFFLLGLIAVISYSINANSILVSLPCFFYIFLHNLKSKKFYFLSFLGLSIGIVLHLLIHNFYNNNPYYVLHGYDLEFSFSYFKDGIKSLNIFLNNVTPIFWKQGWISLFIPIIFSFFFFKKNRINESLFALSIPLILLIPLAVSKVHDGEDSVFFSFSRMYLSVPVLLAILLSFLKINKGKTGYLFILISLVFLSFKVLSFNKEIDESLNKSHIINVIETEKVYEECQQISDIALNYKIDLIVIDNHFFYDFYNYGCPACIPNFPKTLRPSFERRTWRLLEDENLVFSNILFIDLDRNLNNEFGFLSKIENKEGFYILKNNKQPTMHLLKMLNINVRKYK